MRKRIKNKIEKGKFWAFGNRVVWQHHLYQHDPRRRGLMLMYGEDGNECFFDNWRDAKTYVRRLRSRQSPLVVHDSIHLNEDDLPF